MSRTVLNISIRADLTARQLAWFAPDCHPFVATRQSATRLGDEVGATTMAVSAEVRDTFELYRLGPDRQIVGLSEDAFLRLRPTTRARLVREQVHWGRGNVPTVRSVPQQVRPLVQGQADGHRFVWWRRLMQGNALQVLDAYLADGRRPSLHGDVPPEHWRQVARIVPGAQRLAGRYPDRSGPNCFGAVMAACGVEGAEQEWVMREPFDAWLTKHTRRGGSDDGAGTVLVWRAPDGQADHAAVTIGGGWLLHKPSQGWMSPWKILTVAGGKSSARARGRRLTRHQLG